MLVYAVLLTVGFRNFYAGWLSLCGLRTIDCFRCRWNKSVYCSSANINCCSFCFFQLSLRCSVHCRIFCMILWCTLSADKKFSPLSSCLYLNSSKCIGYDTLWNHKLYLFRAPKSWRVASLICCTEPQKNRVMKKTKNRNRDAQKKNRLVV